MSLDSLADGRIRLWTPVEEVESEALTQLKKVAALPWVFHHVAVMPDVHVGKGATVGSVIAMKNAVAPAAVGVDIGCGMGAIETTLRASDLPSSLAPLRARIEEVIPVGFNSHQHAHWMAKEARLFSEFGQLDPLVQDIEGKARKQCGTLGGGNHFIELCLDDGKCRNVIGSGSMRDPFRECHKGLIALEFDEVVCDECKGTGWTEPHVWMMLHSGSRNIGKTLAEIHMERARKLTHNAELPDKDLAVFLSGTPEMAAYRHDIFWAQRYAFLNRQVMFELYKAVMEEFFPQVQFGEAILCHHNYVAEEKHYGEDLVVTRKGAISAKRGELGIIPGSMGTRSFIVRGLGNEESFMSASHGAGRRLSRGAAKRKFTTEDIALQLGSVECRRDAAIIDELPGAYKDIEVVMQNQRDLVSVVAELKQVLCVKG